MSNKLAVIDQLLPHGCSLCYCRGGNWDRRMSMHRDLIVIVVVTVVAAVIVVVVIVVIFIKPGPEPSRMPSPHPRSCRCLLLQKGVHLEHFLPSHVGSCDR